MGMTSEETFFLKHSKKEGKQYDSAGIALARPAADIVKAVGLRPAEVDRAQLAAAFGQKVHAPQNMIMAPGSSPS